MEIGQNLKQTATEKPVKIDRKRHVQSRGPWHDHHRCALAREARGEVGELRKPLINIGF